MPKIALSVNSQPVSHDVEGRLLLVDFIREVLGLTGTHVGCDTSQCGACVVHVNGQPVKSCTLLAVQADGADVTTIEGVSPDQGLNPLQQAFHEKHGLQCGFCTPGMLLTACELLERNPDPTEAEVREGLAGNLCMCTGYVNIVRAVLDAALKMRSGEAAEASPGAVPS